MPSQLLQVLAKVEDAPNEVTQDSSGLLAPVFRAQDSGLRACDASSSKPMQSLKADGHLQAAEPGRISWAGLQS